MPQKSWWNWDQVEEKSCVERVLDFYPLVHSVESKEEKDDIKTVRDNQDILH